MRRSLILLLLLALLVSACSSPAPTPTVGSTTEEPVEPSPVPPTDTPTPVPPTSTPTEVPPTNTPAPSPTPEPVAYGPDNFPDNVNPLTGLVVSDPQKLERRPLAVKIQTYPRGSRPAWGVSLADIVYDYYQNTGLIRLHAIFYSQDAEQVGPIRSGRLLDAMLVSSYKSVFAFGGADRRILNQLYAADFADEQLILEGGRNCPPMCRIDPNGYNYLVTNTEDLSSYASANGVENARPNLDGMRFDPQTPQGGEAGTRVDARYSISAYLRWDYDPETGRYLRFQDSQEAQNAAEEVYEPFVDGLNNQQVAADNVVILFVPHTYEYRAGNSEIVQVDLHNSGKAYAFRDGQAYELQWQRPGIDSVVYLTYPDGTRYPFKPGTTWFEVVGQNSTTQALEEGAWRFEHKFP